MTNRIIDRYASAARSGNLASHPDTTRSDADVLGAVGLAGRHSPLAMALLRLFVGDNNSARQLVLVLAAKLVGKAHRLDISIARVEAEDIARAVLAWHRDGVCTVCGGHGYRIIHGTCTVGKEPCSRCHGTSRLPFDAHFPGERLELARWLLAEIEREEAIAGVEAMRALAPRRSL